MLATAPEPLAPADHRCAVIHANNRLIRSLVLGLGLTFSISFRTQYGFRLWTERRSSTQLRHELS